MVFIRRRQRSQRLVWKTLKSVNIKSFLRDCQQTHFWVSCWCLTKACVVSLQSAGKIQFNDVPHSFKMCPNGHISNGQRFLRPLENMTVGCSKWPREHIILCPVRRPIQQNQVSAWILTQHGLWRWSNNVQAMPCCLTTKTSRWRSFFEAPGLFL